MSREVIKRALKPLLGLLILALLIAQLDNATLKDIIFNTKTPFFFGAIVLCTVANGLCALRWQRIAHRFGPSINLREFLVVYFQGVAANTVLPGGILGGDLWRTVSLARRGFTKSKAAHTVVLDRVAGFWALVVVSLIALAIAWLRSIIPPQTSIALITIYGILLCVIAILPIIFIFFGPLKDVLAIYKTALISIISQLMFMAGFWCCLRAVDIGLDTTLVIAACAAIFLGAVVPASIGGYGSREVAVIFFLGAVGVSQEAGFVASVMFGLTSTIQGILFLPLTMRKFPKG